MPVRPMPQSRSINTASTRCAAPAAAARARQAGLRVVQNRCLMIDHAGFRTAFAVLALLPLVSWWWVRRQAVPTRSASGAAPPAVAPRAWDLMVVISGPAATAVNVAGALLIGAARRRVPHSAS